MVNYTLPSLSEEEASLIDRENNVPSSILSRLELSGLLGPYTGVETAKGRIESVRVLARDSVGLASVVLINLSVQFLLYHVVGYTGDGLAIEVLSRGLSAVSLTEKGGGSDLARNVTVKAEGAGGSYCLNGEKIFTSNGLYADYFLVLALYNGEPSLFLTDDKSSIEVEPLNLSSFRGAGISRVLYKCARAVRLGEGKALGTVLQAINLGRLGYAAIGVGIAEGALFDAFEYAKSRSAFGKSLKDFQGIQWMIADAYSRLESVRALYKQAVDQLPNIDPVDAAVLKNEAAHIAQKAAWIDVEIHGGRGLEFHSKPERLYRDSRALDIGEGAREVLRTYIASSITRNPGLITR
ncbi:MAG: acyl-CoA/acyl-ACP dehydrogenase [Desulfurococcales archaeon]|nr:acyl-CoA/acyl-ACP dehydrogenase [Desulfurococcales archaeon]